MQTQNANWQQWLTLVVILIMTLGFTFNVADIRTGTPAEPVVVEFPDSIAATVDIDALAISLNEKLDLQLEIPEIDAPDTILSVRDYKLKLSEELSIEEMEDKDFKKYLMRSLNEVSREVEIERYNDIKSYEIKDVDEVRVQGETATIEVEFKVNFENYGDEAETARVTVELTVTDLDRSDDYEDAEVDSYSNFKLVRFYGDLA